MNPKREEYLFEDPTYLTEELSAFTKRYGGDEAIRLLLGPAYLPLLLRLSKAINLPSRTTC